MSCFPFAIVDCDGNPIEPELDADGNQVIRLCPQSVAPKFVDWNSATDDGPPTDSDCCQPGTDTDGAFAVDAATGCVSHVCRDGEWLCIGGLPIDPETGEPPPPVLDRICYDLSACGGFPLAYGGGEGGWVVNGVNVLADIECDSEPTPTFPSSVDWTCDYSNPTTGNTPNSWQGIGWTDTGQGEGSTTLVEATGDPADETYVAGGWPCTRPSFRVDFGVAAGAGSGPYSLDLEVLDRGGAINFGLYDKVNDSYLPITGWSTSESCSEAFVNSSPMGDILGVNTATCSGSGPIAVHIDYANPNNTDAADLCLMITAMGNYSGDPTNDNNERVDNAVLTYTPAPTALGTCCATLATAGAVAALLTSNDPNGLIWAADGNSVCTTETQPGQSELYGALSLCPGSAEAADCVTDPVVVPVT